MCLFSWCDLAICPRRNLGPMNLDRSENLTVADPELQIRGARVWLAQFGQFGLNMRAGRGGGGGFLGRSRLPLNPPLLKNFLFPTVCCQKFFQSSA